MSQIYGRVLSMTKMYYKGSDAAIIVYDITNLTSFQKMQRWVEEIDNVNQ